MRELRPAPPADQGVPLLAHIGLDEVVAHRGGRAVCVRDFIGDVQRTADRIEGSAYLLNLCVDRYDFAVGLGAALLRSATTLLPPSGAPAMLEQIGSRYAARCALIDGSTECTVQGIPSVRVCSGTGAHGTTIPCIDPGIRAVVAFTSGSTGSPAPQVKTWGSLVQGAQEEMEGLCLDASAPTTLVGTVPPQHMYGLESTVLLGLRGGIALHAARPLYPADVRDVLERTPGRRVLVTTPVHLRALVEAGLAMPDLHRLVCATAPLTRNLAERAERLFRAPLKEIYGFTEAGMVATRRTATDEAWQTLPGVEVRAVEGVAHFHGGHVPGELCPSDQLDVIDSRRFTFQGRGADLVNVAGKRASIAHLNDVLNSIEGVLDGVFFMPADSTDGSITRPIAFVVAPGLRREQISEALRQHLDPVFLPRPLHLLPSLPRNDTGKLTRAQLEELAARLGAEPHHRHGFVLAPDDPIAQGHFPGNPVVPGAVLLDRVIRLAEQRLRVTPAHWRIPMAKFLRPVRPGDRVDVIFKGSDVTEMSFECHVDQTVVASGRLIRHATV